MKCTDLGLQQHRLDGDEYIAVIDEFMESVFTRWPHVIVQVIFSPTDFYMSLEICFIAFNIFLILEKRRRC